MPIAIAIGALFGLLLSSPFITGGQIMKEMSNDLRKTASHYEENLAYEKHYGERLDCLHQTLVQMNVDVRNYRINGTPIPAPPPGPLCP